MGSIVDVAREAKVSLGTASLVLNHPHRVAPETLRQVRQVMERMGYQPRPNRRRTAAVATRSIGFVYPELAIHNGALSSYYVQVINGAKEEFGTYSNVNAIRGTAQGETDLMFQHQVEAREFAGVIVFGSGKFNIYAERVMNAGLPVVLINSTHPDSRSATVTADYYMGAQQALEHASNLGHRRMAMLYAIRNDRKAAWSTEQISRGLNDAGEHVACKAIQFELPKQQVLQDTRIFCERALKEKATVLLVGDLIATQCADTLAEMGLRVPEDISIISFDNFRLKTSRGQELTSVGFDKTMLGRLAAQMMRQMIESRGKLRWLRSGLVTHIFNGQTCGPAKV